MNKSQLIEAIAEKSGEDSKRVQRCLTAYIDVLCDTLKRNEKIVIRGFGSFDWKAAAEDEEAAVVFRVSPRFSEACRRETEDGEAPREEHPMEGVATQAMEIVESDEMDEVDEMDEQEEPVPSIGAGVFAHLRETLMRPASPGGWWRLVHAISTLSKGDPDHELAVDYIQQHIAENDEWLAYTRIECLYPHATKKRRATLQRRALKQKKSLRFVASLEKRDQSAARALEVNKAIRKAKKSKLADFPALIAEVASPDELSISNRQIHYAGWTHKRATEHAKQTKILKRIEKEAKLAKHGIRLFMVYNYPVYEIDYDYGNGYSSQNGEVLLISDSGENALLIRAEGSATYKADEYGYPRFEEEDEEELLYLDEVPFCRGCSIEEFNHGYEFASDFLCITEKEFPELPKIDSYDHTEDVIVFGFFKQLQKAFPGTWDDVEQYEEDKAPYLPQMDRLFLGLREFFAETFGR